MTDQKLKTLREIADEVGFPFEAEERDRNNVFKCIAIGPDGNALGWYLSGNWHLISTVENQSAIWTIVTPKKKLVEFLYEFPKNEYHTMIKNTESDAQQFCRNLNATFIKVLREVEL